MRFDICVHAPADQVDRLFTHLLPSYAAFWPPSYGLLLIVVDPNETLPPPLTRSAATVTLSATKAATLLIATIRQRLEDLIAATVVASASLAPSKPFAFVRVIEEPQFGPISAADQTSDVKWGPETPVSRQRKQVHSLSLLPLSNVSQPIC